MIKLIKTLLLLFALVFASRAISCDYPVTVKDGNTKCSGVLLSDQQFLDASNDKKKLRLQDFKIAELEGTVELMELRHSVYRKELDKARSSLSDLEFKSNIGYVISFSFGAILTGYIAKEVLK